MQRLSDFGERRLISEVLLERYGSKSAHFGDDVAIALTRGSDNVVITTDPAPFPVAWELGIGGMYEWGWLLCAINISDLAAAGATPVCLVTSLTLPSDTPLAEFIQLLDGIDDCSAAHNALVVGGNLKESTERRAEATAVGIVNNGLPLSRKGARPGDFVAAFGPTGHFWSAVVAKQRGLVIESKLWEPLLKTLTLPKAQVEIGVDLRVKGIARACTDASDGIYGSMWTLAVDSGLGVVIDYEGLDYLPEVQFVADSLRLDPFRLALGFGNLELVAAIASDRLEDARQLANELSVNCTVLGRFTADRGIRLSIDGKEELMNNFDNQRFTAESQFTAGLEAFGERLFREDLVVTEL